MGPRLRAPAPRVSRGEHLVNAKGHMLTGSLMCGAVGPLLPSPMGGATSVIVSAVLGAPLALLMDLDTRGKAYYSLMPLSLVLKPLLVWLSKLLFYVTRGPKDSEQTSGHRMFTHQNEFPIILALVTLWATWGTGWEVWAAGTVFVGVWAHRAGDACTKAGVPICLTRVIWRSIRDADRVWLTVGIPRPLRFVSGGAKGAKMFGAKVRRPWDILGERVVTQALFVLLTVLLLATAYGLYPVVIA